MVSSDSSPAVAGGPARHIPVLVRPALDLLAVRDGGIYVDATFGGGGYSRELLAAANCSVVAIDRDPSALARAADLLAAAAGRLVLGERKFSQLEAFVRAAGHDFVDGVVFDLGVSSFQLDDPARGFSFRHDGPLDMRMGGSEATAADVVAAASAGELARIIATLGEEHRAKAIARAIVAARRNAPLRTTRALTEIISKVVHARPDSIHPATRTFQALRIFVNDELVELAAGLTAAEKILRPGGKLVVVAFHSLEDRIVKTFLAERSRHRGSSRHRPAAAAHKPTFRLLVKRPIVADEIEVRANPRARSAKLRAAERTDARIFEADSAALLPRLPSISEIIGRSR
jgi:16S rRNA (cytosine1402-N4)-methyltransferase